MRNGVSVPSMTATRSVTLNMSVAQYQEVVALARRHQLSVSAVLRLAVESGLPLVKPVPTQE